MTVRLTEVTDDALAGTVRAACSWRRGESACTAPRSQVDVPLPLPQPKMNAGAAPTSGTDCSLSVASGMVPPDTQAVTVHWAGWPRSLVAWAGTTSRQRLTWSVCETVLAWCERVRVGVGVAEGAAAAGDDLRFLLGVADGESVVLVGVADGLPELGGGDELEGALLAEGEDDGAAECLSVLVWDGDGPGGAGGCTGAHDRLLPAARLAAAAELDTTATPTPEAAVNRTPPATMAAIAGRACAKRIRTPYQYC